MRDETETEGQVLNGDAILSRLDEHERRISELEQLVIQLTRTPHHPKESEPEDDSWLDYLSVRALNALKANNCTTKAEARQLGCGAFRHTPNCGRKQRSRWRTPVCTTT